VIGYDVEYVRKGNIFLHQEKADKRRTKIRTWNGTEYTSSLLATWIRKAPRRPTIMASIESPDDISKRLAIIVLGVCVWIIAEFSLGIKLLQCVDKRKREKKQMSAASFEEISRKLAKDTPPFQ
jgi:hypothetical protein